MKFACNEENSVQFCGSGYQSSEEVELSQSGWRRCSGGGIEERPVAMTEKKGQVDEVEVGRPVVTMGDVDE